MNTLESTSITSPFGDLEECAKFTIYDVTDPFVLHGITHTSRRYTLSFWIKSNISGSITIQNTNIPVNTEWKKEVLTFVADGVDLAILFNNVSTFYMYQSQLEIGNKDSDWKEAPEDTDETIQSAQQAADTANSKSDDALNKIERTETIIEQLRDSLRLIVTDGANGNQSMMEQLGDGWTFNIGPIQDTLNNIAISLVDLQTELGSAASNVEILSKTISDVQDNTTWIKMGQFEGEPCIALGAIDSAFKLIITNTRIMFAEGNTIPAYISNQALNIKKAVIEDELQQGEFVWKTRRNGNMGLIWKGAIK